MHNPNLPPEDPVAGTVEAPVEVIDRAAEEQAEMAKEKQEAKEQFGDLIGLVDTRYQKLPEGVRQEFMVHNDEILGKVIDMAKMKGMAGEDLKAIEIAAILHDLNKADDVPEKYKDVPNYALVAHGEIAANSIQELLTDEKLKSYGFEGDPQQTRDKIAAAIREHMGPHPGFMTAMLDKANQALDALGEPKFEHPRPKGVFSEVMLAADMDSLAGTKGRRKVMALRFNAPFFKQQDAETVEKYRAAGIELSPGEAALLSGFDSAFQARDMIQDPDLKVKVISSIDGSMGEEYLYGQEKIDAKEALAKQDRFKARMEHQQLEEKEEAVKTKEEQEIEAIRDRIAKL